MQPITRLGLGLGVGVAAGVVLGAVSGPPESDASAISRIAVGGTIAGAAGAYMLRGPSGVVARSAAMLGAVLVGFGATHIARN